MATIRPGTATALLVIDVQVGVMRGAWDAARVIGNVGRAVASARAAAVPVIWIQHADAELVPDTPDWKWVPELVREPGETLIGKRFNSAFEATSLADELARRDVAHVVIAGAATNWCIRATAYGALDRGYDVTLVADAHTTKSMPLDDGVVVDAQAIVRELNVTLQWLEYPGRRNAVTSADALFATEGA